MNIRKKLTLLLLLVSAVPLMMFAIINMYLAQDLAVKNALTENAISAELVESKVDHVISSNLQGLQVLAKNNILRSYNVSEMKPVSAKPTGVLQGSMDLDVLTTFVKELSTQDMTVYMIDQKGQLLAHPTYDR